jgi:hypothetical protein
MTAMATAITPTAEPSGGCTAGNATPVVSFTVTYAVANVLLTLWGPIIVGIITKNAQP